MSGDAPKILFVTPAPPEAVTGGGGTATRNVIDLLASIGVGAEVEVFAFGSGQGSHRLRQIAALLRSTLSPWPSKTHFAVPRGAAERLAARVANGGYDLVVINGGELFCVADLLPDGLPLIGVAHNVEHVLFAGQTRSWRALPFSRWFFERDLGKLTRGELDGARRIGNLICLSAEDAEQFEAHGAGVNQLVLSTSFQYRRHERDAERAVGRPLQLGFLARYSWWPNVEAVTWFVEQVLPRLSEGSVELNLFGPGAERFRDVNPAVRARGFVDQLSTVWDESDLVVCPMVSGSGINIKFIEAVYNRCPVLATTMTARGLPKFEDPAVKLLDGAAAWAEFLAGDEAVALASNRPLAATADLFSHERARGRLADFVRGVLDG